MSLKHWISAALIAVALPATAATVDESTYGDYSSIWTAPTVLGAGSDIVRGTGAAGDVDVLAFTGLAAWVTGVRIDFSAASYVSPNAFYSAGGSVLYSTSPFQWAWGGTTAGTFGIGYMTASWGTIGSTETSMTIPLSLGGSPTLYLAIANTYGAGLDFTLSFTGSAPPPPPPTQPPAVPLPATAGLLLTGMAALGVITRRRRKARG